MLQEYERFPNWDIDVEEGKIWSKKIKRYIGSIQGNVSACCQGKRKTHKGYKWKYLNE